MLNPFPIQFLALFAYFLLRLFIGGILAYLGIRHFKNSDRLGIGRKWGNILAGTESTIAIFILLGAHTQYAALALMALCILMVFYHKKFEPEFVPQRLFYILLCGTAFTLFITGAGALAFDLPI